MKAELHACSSPEAVRKAPWGQRKIDHLKRLQEVCAAKLLVSCSDKPYNVRAITLDLSTEGVGEAVFNRFRAATLRHHCVPADQYAVRVHQLGAFAAPDHGVRTDRGGGKTWGRSHA